MTRSSDNPEQTRQLESTFEVPSGGLDLVLRVKTRSDHQAEDHPIPANRPFFVGSSIESSLTLSDKTVSGLHLELRLGSDGVIAKDLGSTNGTFYRGQRITSMTIRPGDELQVGRNTTLQLVALNAQDTLPPSQASRFGGLLGRSAKMRAVFGVLERATQAQTTVLITGETGTGKDVAAEAIHRASGRKDGPFVVVDCASIPKNLFESELFGHLKGSFTGASEDRRGAFFEAHGGTIFFDEIAELPIDVQPRLLRALESRRVKPVGSDQSQPVDVRVIAATHRSLEDAIEAGTFRSDLFYRLAVIRVEMPALRDRRDDIVLLARHFADRFEAQSGRALELSPELSAAMLTYDWPGNVRELRNIVQQASSLTRQSIELALKLSQDANPLHEVGGLGMEQFFGLPFREARDLANEAFEKGYAKYNLDRAAGDLAEAAAKTGLTRATLKKLTED